MKKKGLAVLLAACLLVGLWGCGGEAGSSSAAPSSGRDVSTAAFHTESYGACSSMEFLLEDMARMGAELPEEVPVPDAGVIGEAFGARFSTAMYEDGSVLGSFWRDVDYDEMAQLYGLSLKRPQSELVLEPGGSLPGRARWETACRELNFYCGIEPAEEFPREEPGEELDWKEEEGHPGVETAVVIHTKSGEPVWVFLRWKADGHLFRAQLPGDCLETFWAHQKDLITTMKTGAGNGAASGNSSPAVSAGE